MDQASPLQTELARQILDLARDESWAEGRRVPEQTLARRLGVSRSPVRGALRLLASRGVLRQEPGLGFILSAPVPDPVSGGEIVPRSEADDLFAVMASDRANGHLPAEVSESELSERYGASRGVIRKVLLRFAAEGLAYRQRGHGWRFAEMLDNPEAVAESYRFRIAVECAALRQPSFAPDRARLDQLCRAHEEIMAKAPGTVTREEWFRINAAFHEALAAWSGNRFILQAVRQQNSLRRIQEYAAFERIGPERIEQSCREHIGILAALKDGDVDFAEALLRRHLSLAAISSDDRRGRSADDPVPPEPAGLSR